MAIVGERPESGVRIAITRGAEGPPWRYEGAAHVPAASLPLAVLVAEDGTIEVTIDADADLREKIRLLVRALAKSGVPPRRIVRWRGDK